jgi:hypothetical protein
MKNLTKSTSAGKRKKGRAPTLTDLHDFPWDGIHRHLFVLANWLHNWKHPEVGEQDAIRLISSKFEGGRRRRKLQPREVEEAVYSAYRTPSPKRATSGIGSKRPPKTSEGGYWECQMKSLNVKQNDARILEAMNKTPWALEEVWEESPHKADACTPAEILSMLFEPGDLLCCGTMQNPRTKTLFEWLKSGSAGELVVPNPMRTRVGVNMKGKPSTRCRDNTGRRRHIVYECDDENLDFDEKASLIRYLRQLTEARLCAVIHSGGKSLHAWFRAHDDEAVNYKFMQLAVTLGGDPQMWYPEQSSRLPNATRSSNGKPQKLLYLDPQ